MEDIFTVTSRTKGLGGMCHFAEQSCWWGFRQLVTGTVGSWPKGQWSGNIFFPWNVTMYCGGRNGLSCSLLFPPLIICLGKTEALRIFPGPHPYLILLRPLETRIVLSIPEEARLPSLKIPAMASSEAVTLPRTILRKTPRTSPPTLLLSPVP